jgi:twitching motility protein PilI
MEQAIHNAGVSLPEEKVVAEQWVGLGFKVGDAQLVAAMGQIQEVVPCVPLASVQRTRSWMRGIANIRGTLVTVIDLQAYLGLEPVIIDQYSRLIVINDDALQGCLLVNRLQGLRHFDPVQDRCEIGQVQGNLAQYVVGGLCREQQKWLVFDINRLVSDRNFRQVAA